MWQRFPDQIQRVHAGPDVLNVILTLAVIAALLALVAWVVFSMRRATQPAVIPARAGMDPAMAEARMRYARAEIGRDDYLRIAADLGGAPEPPGEPP